MARRPATASHPVERPDGSIVAHGRQRDPRTAEKVAAHLAALSPRRWVPPSERQA